MNETVDTLAYLTLLLVVSTTSCSLSSLWLSFWSPILGSSFLRKLKGLSRILGFLYMHKGYTCFLAFREDSESSCSSLLHSQNSLKYDCCRSSVFSVLYLRRGEGYSMIGRESRLMASSLANPSFTKRRFSGSTFKRRRGRSTSILISSINKTIKIFPSC